MGAGNPVGRTDFLRFHGRIFRQSIVPRHHPCAALAFSFRQRGNPRERSLSHSQVGALHRIFRVQPFPDARHARKRSWMEIALGDLGAINRVGLFGAGRISSILRVQPDRVTVGLAAGCDGSGSGAGRSVDVDSGACETNDKAVNGNFEMVTSDWLALSRSERWNISAGAARDCILI
jgi:hypothetical protein